MSEIRDFKVKRSRHTPVFIAGTFILFILIAFVAYKFGLHPSSTKNFGELVSPARPLPEFNLKTIDDKPFTLEDIRRKWSYLYIVESECDAACKLNLVKMNNARLAQGTESTRVKYYLVFSKKPEKQEVDELVKDHPKMTILYMSGAVQQKFFKVFKTPEDDKVHAAQRVYLIDPIGNYMMYYEPDAEAIGFMEDLKFLLKVSQIG